MLFFSQTFNPPAVPSDPAAAEAQAYHNAYAGVWAVVLAFLGERLGPPTVCHVWQARKHWWHS